MSDTRTTVRHQIAVGALTHHPVPKVRTVSTTQVTGELSLRYIPRPAPAPDMSTDVTCDEWPEDDARWVSEYPGLPRTSPFIPHAAGCKIGDIVDVRHGWFLAGRRGVIVSYDRDHDEFGVQFSSDGQNGVQFSSDGQKYVYSIHALEPVDTKSLLPCPGPATDVPRSGPDTLIDRTYRRELLCFPV